MSLDYCHDKIQGRQRSLKSNKFLRTLPTGKTACNAQTLNTSRKELIHRWWQDNDRQLWITSVPMVIDDRHAGDGMLGSVVPLRCVW